MYAEVDLTLERRNDALSVPITAVDLNTQSSADDDASTNNRRAASGRVMVVTAQNRLESRVVNIGLETPNWIEIRSGLREGELVVIGNRAGLQPGELVRPKITTITAKEAF
jgi:macrolide-specific efflux system membrane fusion protein